MKEGIYKVYEKTFDVVVCGGGLAGFSCAVSAARAGLKTVLIHDRPVLGGNSSSEIGVTPHGAASHHHYGRETGIISEAIIQERAINHERVTENGWTNSVWDMVLYGIATKEKNLELFLNTSVVSVELDSENKKIKTVYARGANNETNFLVSGHYFVDATGDGVIAASAGCEYRWGAESKAEFGEYHAPEKSGKEYTMGTSIHFKSIDTGHPVEFELPDWAYKFEDKDFFEKGRMITNINSGFWWLELGVPYDTIYDNEKIRDELTKYTLGLWDWIKNRDTELKELAKNHALDWIGQVPGKRESRRIMGERFLIEQDIRGPEIYDDEIGFGGWFIDLHSPGGLLAASSEPRSEEKYNPYGKAVVASHVPPYSIPLGITIAKDLENLFMVGRNVSVSHAVFGSIRVMSTLATLGQGVGSTIAHCVQNGKTPKKLQSQDFFAIKQALLKEDCFLLNTKNEDPQDLARQAVIRASSSDKLYGASPNSHNYAKGQSLWLEHYNPRLTDKLDTPHGQIIPTGKEGIKTIKVLLQNLSDINQSVAVSLKKITSVWDYREMTDDVLFTGSLTVAPNLNPAWYTIDLDISTKEGELLRLDIGPNEAIVWPRANKTVPGCVSMYGLTDGQMAAFFQGSTLSFKVSPAQSCYEAKNILDGWARTYVSTSLWRACPEEIEDSWVELEWEQEQTISEVMLTFPGNILREYHAYEPFYRDSECPKEFTICALDAYGEFTELIEEKNNYQRHRKYTLEVPVKTRKLRIYFQATNGDPSAGLYQIRVY